MWVVTGKRIGWIGWRSNQRLTRSLFPPIRQHGKRNEGKMMTKATVAGKVWTVVALCLAVSGSAIGFLMFQLKTTSASYDETLKNLQARVREQDMARRMQVTFKKQVQEWKDTLLRGYNPADLAKYSGQFHSDAGKVKEIGSELSAEITDEEAHALIAQFLEAHAALLTKYEAALQVFTATHGTNPRDADNRVKGEDRAPTDLVDRIVTVLSKRANAAVSSEKEAVARRIWIVSLAVLAAFVLIVALAAATIGRISRTLLGAVANLSEIADQVTGAATQVSSSSQSLAQGSSEQAASLQETSASSEEINSMARRNTDDSRAAADLVAASQQKFIETNRSLEQTVAAMDQINAQSGKISKIIKTIDEIAFQTNILALNAAVEAARAGEAGMGFAVVADEVRNLAQRCAQAARDTAELIEESVAKSSDGKAKVDQVATAIRGVTEEAAKVKMLVDAVSLGSREQARGVEQVSKAITQIEQVTQTTAANAEEGAAAAEELNAQSAALKDVVSNLAAMVGGDNRRA
jgi:methyl-accepting chemotaxis protein